MSNRIKPIISENQFCDVINLELYIITAVWTRSLFTVRAGLVHFSVSPLTENDFVFKFPCGSHRFGSHIRHNDSDTRRRNKFPFLVFYVTPVHTCFVVCLCHVGISLKCCGSGTEKLDFDVKDRKRDLIYTAVFI